MPISWNEIRARAQKFSAAWKHETREEAEAQTFWNEFFEVFDLNRRAVASFEEPVKNLKGDYGFIDLFWPGVVLVEHKSKGKDLGKAESQAMAYIRALAKEGRKHEIPRYVILSDFSKIALYDLEDDSQSLEFPLKDLPKKARAFAFMLGGKSEKEEDEEDADFKAARIMGELHDALKASGYSGHDLERMLVRILFCLFAEDSRIFEPNQFRDFLHKHTRADGSDTGAQLARLFAVLDTPPAARQKNMDEDLAAFPYVNGGLFKERLAFAEFDKAQRQILLDTTHFNWERISPAIFGSLFQGVMDSKARRQVGAHYTGERDIMKVIDSLFLDDLKAEFQAVKSSKKNLAAFHEKLGRLKFFDPACGCGNFLILTYRELRLLEMAVLKAQFKGDKQTAFNIRQLCRVDISAMFGIEIEEWPAMIAEVALWLMDHQMNLKMAEEFGDTKPTIPLGNGAKIVHGNSLRMDWKEVCPAVEGVFVLGNPPFIGHHLQTEAQKEEQHATMRHIQAAGVMDYVANWYIKAGEFIQGTRIAVGFVSTNSISQGEQPGILWADLFSRLRLKIHFAHRTFAWQSEAKGKAHVHVVIIGFGAFDRDGKKIFDYADLDGETATIIPAKNISPYLVEGGDCVVGNRSTPLCAAPGMKYGSKPTDGGHFILDKSARNELLKLEPGAKPYVWPYLGADDVLNGEKRWCLWLADIQPNELKQLPEVMKRVNAVRDFRLKSTAESTRKYADFPTLFRQIAPPSDNFILIPGHSSENRKYIPLTYFSKANIVSNSSFFVDSASLFHFAILTSQMHMAWMRQVCGRLESRYRYSKDIVYNNFPWPNPSEPQKAKLEKLAQAILDARAKFPDSTLADLYDPVSMPPALAKAHADLDAAVDAAYRKAPFANDRERVEYLFGEYEKLTAKESAPLLAGAGKAKKTPAKKAAAK